MAGGSSQKSQYWSAIVLLFVVVALIGVYFLWMSNRDDANISPTLLTNSSTTTTNSDGVLYKTFSNEEKGFRIQYPDTWLVEETSSSEDADAIYTVQFRNDSQGVALSVMPLSLKGIVRNSISITDEEETTINGTSATRLTGTDAKDGGEYTVILIESGDQLYSISGSGQMFEEIVNYFALI